MKILHLEDNLADAELVHMLLRQEWPACEIAVRAARTDFVTSLKTGRYDVVLSDFQLPGFDGMEALGLARHLAPDTPFVFLSGTIGEERAIEALRQGASDYVLKENMKRLPVAIQRAVQDARERKDKLLAEQSLSANEKLLRQLIAHTPAAIAMFDNEMRYLQVSRRWLSDYGLGATEIIGCCHYDIFPEIPERWKEIHRRALAGHAQRCEEDSFVRPDGTIEWLQWEILPWHRPDGGIGGVIFFTQVISDRKRMQEQLLRAQRMENLGQLAAGIAHDLNNILSPVLMAAPLLRRHATRPEDLRVLDAVEKSAERGGALVKQILSFARGAGSERILLQPKHVLREIGELMGDTFPKNIRLDIDIAPDLWTVQANPTQLHQVVLNLCINARDAMPAGGTLTLRARNDPARLPGIVLEVGDTGVGIPPENHARIFEPFFTTKGERGGTGLGLATVRGIVTAHRGRIALESAPGFGSTFRVWLPASGDDVAASGPAGSRRPFSIHGNGELILVVDDEPSISEIITQILVKSGFQVIAAADGAEMLDRHLARLPEVALALLDVDLPGQDGLSLGRILQRIQPAQRVLFMTGYGGTPGGARLAPPSGCPMLKKPFTGDELLGAVQGAIAAPPFVL